MFHISIFRRIRGDIAQTSYLLDKIIPIYACTTGVRSSGRSIDLIDRLQFRPPFSPGHSPPPLPPGLVRGDQHAGDRHHGEPDHLRARQEGPSRVGHPPARRGVGEDQEKKNGRKQKTKQKK